MDLKERKFDDSVLVETKLSSEPIFDGHVIRVFKDTVALSNGKTATREVVRHNGATCIVPITDSGEVLMVRQFRYALGRITLEIPAGKIDPGESPEVCAVRELAEETGYTSNNIVYLGELHTSVGFCDEVIHMYAAKDLVRHELSPDEDEFLNLSAIPLDTLEEMCISGEITDSKTLSAILKVSALRRRGEI